MGERRWMCECTCVDVLVEWCGYRLIVSEQPQFLAKIEEEKRLASQRPRMDDAASVEC
jgi:hypothetical protein